MNKSIQNPIDITLVTKSNLFESLYSFQSNLSNPLFNYAIFNCDFSALTHSTPNREIVFTEISLCHQVNTSQDISHRVFTYLIPSMKFNKFTSDAKITFSSECLKYLFHNKAAYNLKDLTSKNALSYSNLSNEPLISASLSRILLDGKKSKKENMKSYCYYPKALNIHSLVFQRRLEEILKQIAMSIINEDFVNLNEGEAIEAKYLPVSSIEEANFNLVTEVMYFKWNLLFQPYVTDMIKVFIEGIEMSFVQEPQNRKAIEGFCAFLCLIDDFLQSNGQKELLPFAKVFDDVFYENWRAFLHGEMKGKITIAYADSTEEPMVEFKMLKGEETQTDSIKSFIAGLLLLIDSIDDNISKEPIRLNNLYFINYNLLSLLPEEMAKLCQLKYHFGVKLNKKDIKIDKEHSDSIMNKITYEKLYLNVNNKEDILFGYEFETEAYRLLNEMDKKKSGYLSLKPEFGKDMLLLLQSKEVKALFASITSQFAFEEQKGAISSYGIAYSLKDNQEANKDSLRKEICEKAYEYKACLLIQEELGVSLFYQQLFASALTIYGSNLYSKLAYVIPEVFSNESSISIENKVKDFITHRSLKLFDLNYISRANQFSFYDQYLSLAQDGVANITVRFHYIINQIKDKIALSNQNFISSNDSYFNLALCSLTPIPNQNSKALFLSKERFVNSSILSLAKSCGNFMLISQADKEAYRLEFLDSEEKFKALKSSIDK